MLDQHALELERADAVVGGFEDIVHAAHVSQVAFRIARRHIPGVVVAVAHGAGIARAIIQIPLHEPEWPLRQVDADLALLAHAPVRAEQHDRTSGERAPHRAGFDRLPRRVADLRGGLGLPETLTDGDAPGVAHLCDHLGVERFAGARDFAQQHAPGAQVVLDEHTPHRRRCAEARHSTTYTLFKQRPGVEALVLIRQYGRLRIPWRKEARPGVLRPAR